MKKIKITKTPVELKIEKMCKEECKKARNRIIAKLAKIMAKEMSKSFGLTKKRGKSKRKV